MDLFLFDRDLRHERVNSYPVTIQQNLISIALPEISDDSA